MKRKENKNKKKKVLPTIILVKQNVPIVSVENTRLLSSLAKES